MLRRILQLLALTIGLLSGVHAAAAEVLVLNTTGKSPLNTSTQSGFMDDVAAEAMRRIGIELKTVQLPAERGLRNVNAGIQDGEMSRIAGLETSYPNLVRVPEKIMDWEFVVFAKEPVNMEKGWQALSGRAVSYINGWKILEKNVPHDTEVTKVRSPEQLFDLLEKERTEYVIYERWAGRRLLWLFELDKVSIQEPALASKEMFIYLHKKHRKLMPRLSQALAEMKKDGSYAALFKRHLGSAE